MRLSPLSGACFFPARLFSLSALLNFLTELLDFILSKNLPSSRRPVSKAAFESVPRGGSYLPVMAWLGLAGLFFGGRGGLSALFSSLFFSAALFQEKRAWTAGEIVRRAAKGKEAGGRGLSRAQVFRNLRELEAKSRIKNRESAID